ncbi:hypothetical protein [Arthrobacter sp. W4I7]|uniref:hypothetical protein n=1 Tax=Arthrobacter sp. W4I7 TaxID=3042296 RepID=UPI00277FA577|nr:hypothetical protein [Arthrobacter sp. W4I7]MDQ0691340.1 hypothetical protein [Arthrobacter sp. W4I7]
MTSDSLRLADCATLRPGDLVEVQETGHVPCRGVVEDTLPQFNIVWLRDKRTGERRMLFTTECRIFMQET